MRDEKFRNIGLLGLAIYFGFLHDYLNNLSKRKCLEKGTEMSSKIIQKIGARI